MQLKILVMLTVYLLDYIASTYYIANSLLKSDLSV